MCKKFGVFANILLESVPLKTPFNAQSLSEHLEVIFPGLGNRIHMQNDSVLEVSDDVSSLTQYVEYDRSTQFNLTNLNGASANRVGSVKKSAYFPKLHESIEESPEKRFKLDNIDNRFSSPGVSSASVCKQNLGKCMKTFSGVFDQVFDLNIKLEENLRGMEAKYQREIKTLEQQNEHMADQIEILKEDMKHELELMEKSHRLQENKLKQEHLERISKLNEEHEKQLTSKLRDELQAINNKHIHEIALQKAKYEKRIADLETERTKLFMDSYDLIQRKNEERDKAIEEVKRQCKEEYAPLIEEAKGKKYCIACGTGKPLDLFYVCDSNCQRRYW